MTKDEKYKRAFNARAWHDLAVPAYNRLSVAMREAWAAFQEEAKEGRMRQGPDLDTVGFSPEIRARLEGFATEELARASRAVYSCGHWDPGITGGNFTGRFDRYGTGAYWKFANVCDQILRAWVFGKDAEGATYLKRDGKAPKDLKACTIIEGMIRETFQDANSWSWFEVAFASDDYMTHRPARPGMHSEPRGASGRRSPSFYDWKEIEAFGERCKVGEFATEDAKPWLDTSRFMVEDKGYRGFDIKAKFATHKEDREARKWAYRDGITV